MNRIEAFELQWKRRYNRDVEVYNQTETDKDQIVHCKNKIKYKDTTFGLEEYLKDNLTDYALALVGDKQYKFKSYLEAEVFIADQIGEM